MAFIIMYIEGELLENLAKILIEELGEIKINRGKEHNFLRMKIKLLEDKTLEINIV